MEASKRRQKEKGVGKGGTWQVPGMDRCKQYLERKVEKKRQGARRLN
jgi:hypothetical protein